MLATVDKVGLLTYVYMYIFFFQGVVSSMKESFGFIERADKVSEVGFGSN